MSSGGLSRRDVVARTGLVGALVGVGLAGGTGVARAAGDVPGSEALGPGARVQFRWGNGTTTGVVLANAGPDALLLTRDASTSPVVRSTSHVVSVLSPAPQTTARTIAGSDLSLADHGGRAGDPGFDNGPVIRSLVERAGAAGCAVVVPAGEWWILSDVVIERPFVTIRGVNRGLRSGIDMPVAGLRHPGGGSKLMLGPNCRNGLVAPPKPGNRLSGFTVRDLLIAGQGTDRGQCGIRVDRDNDGTQILGVATIDLDQGAWVHGADAGTVEHCWLAECRNPLTLAGAGQANIVANNHLGGQPAGITARLENQGRMAFTGNTVFPDGHTAISAPGAEGCVFSGNAVSSYYTGAVEIEGRFNRFVGNGLDAMLMDGRWAADPRGRDGLWGLLRITGDDNLVAATGVHSLQPVDDTRVHVPGGRRVKLQGLHITGNASRRKVVLNGLHTSDVEVLGTVRPEEADTGGSARLRLG